MVLMTSLSALKQLHYRLKNALSDSQLNVYCQHVHGTKESILERFRSEYTHSILMGVDSFWEGVDLPGILNCVIIPKLPFPVPTDPIISAKIIDIELNGGNGFIDVILPKAVLKFKQGLGRVIRSQKDKGAVFVLDSRILSKSYRKYFLQEMSQFYTIEGNFKNVMSQLKKWYPQDIDLKG